MLPLISPWSRAFLADEADGRSPLTRHVNFTQQIAQRYYTDVNSDRADLSRHLQRVSAPTTLSLASVAPAAIPAAPFPLTEETDGAARAGFAPFGEGAMDEQDYSPLLITTASDVVAPPPSDAEEPPTTLETWPAVQADIALPRLLAAATRPTVEVADSPATQPVPSPVQLSAARRETIRRSQVNRSDATTTSASRLGLQEQGIAIPRQADDAVREQPDAPNQSGYGHQMATSLPVALPMEGPSAPEPPPLAAFSGGSMVEEIERRIQQSAEERLNRSASAMLPTATQRDASPATAEEPDLPFTGGSMVEEIERRIQRSAEQRLQKSDIAATATPSHAFGGALQDPAMPTTAPNRSDLLDQAPLRRARSSKIYSRVEESKQLDRASGYGAASPPPPDQNRRPAPAMENPPAVVDIAPVAQRTATADLITETPVAGPATMAANDAEGDARLGAEEEISSGQAAPLLAAPASLPNSLLMPPAATEQASATIPDGPGLLSLVTAPQGMAPNRLAPSLGEKPEEPTSSRHPQNQPAQGIVIQREVGDAGVFESDDEESDDGERSSLLRQERATVYEPPAADKPALPTLVHRDKASSAALAATAATHLDDSVEARSMDDDQSPIDQERILKPMRPSAQPALVQTPTLQLQRRETRDTEPANSPARPLDRPGTLAESAPLLLREQLPVGEEEVASASGALKKKQNVAANAQTAPVTNTADKAADIEAKIQRVLTNRPLAPAQLPMSAPPLHPQVNRATASVLPALPKVIDLATRPVEMNGAKAQKTAPDLDALARQVAPFVKRLLAIEQEREPF